MQKILWFLVSVTLVGISTNFAYSQEMGLATFQETAQVIVDRSISQNVTASVTLQSTSIQEIRIPAELEQKLREDEMIKAVVVTNQEQCVLGVFDESCIMINVVRDPTVKGIIEIQDAAKEDAMPYIDEINQIFDTDAEFHSVFVHSDDASNEALETSGIISGRGMVSVVYTMSPEDTNSMYEKVSAILIPKIIRDGGGFYEIAKSLSFEEKSKMTFSIIPLDSKSLLQLKLSVDYPNEASTISEVSPLDLLKVDTISRSEYFSSGFYPLNSIIQVVILSPEDEVISNIRGNIVPTQIIDNEKIPTDISKEGWIFDPQEGQRIQGKYIFGEETSVNKDKLKFSLGEVPPTQPESSDESLVVVVIISIVAIAAALFYLKGYRK
ncbi:hypothetical protein AAA799E16_00604 [Marine Group I thaumarchaeote SCGC AAA799-E16]|uniref:Uncharacterized protein n=4 Tax=Marine Group I TaxID=905826 RepID=A0A081RL85_9ARCH|nr:hypothetical protein AAA799N04_01638 [Marine Group I thaumarchaeote SCGC AAA799-N04]KER06687.1 hypothetical protein AAA799E16_00604 [Marine Group I thaumarchaeote SCGC AAA799-E16]KFM16164.1 hypothetical protein AAA799D11_00968 [Marine Group I thaumarchaeote SCGC AAA799-D11]KFM17901.1 hypothetical protein SCCGRSA3_01846 [Marine Group I thaumarchaeote SCGC RSA3]